MGESQRLIAQNSKLLQPGTAASGQKRACALASEHFVLVS